MSSVLAQSGPLVPLESNAQDSAIVTQSQEAVVATQDTASFSPTSLGPVQPMHEAFARPPSGSWIHARQAQESAIITAVRRQMEALEDRLCAHVARELQRAQQQGDRLREAAVARLEAKVAQAEAAQPKLDRRLAELGGNYRGLSEEMQAQIRRVDQTDARLWEWRHQLDEDLRARLAELEQACQQAGTAARVSKAATDDALKRFAGRLTRLEELFEERAAHAEDLGQSLMDLHGRCLQLEDDGSRRNTSPASARFNLPLATSEEAGQGTGAEADAGAGALALVQKQGADFQRKLEQLETEAGELGARVELQEERTRALRTLCEAREEQCRLLGDRLERENWDGRLRELHSRVHDQEQNRLAHAEQLEILHQKVTLQEPLALARASPCRRAPEPSEANSDAGHSASRLAQAEARIGALGEELETIRTDLELAPRVAALVAALKDVAPKVIHHETVVGQLEGRLGELSEVAPRLTAHEETVGQLSGRVGELAEFASTSREVEQRACALLEDLQARQARLEEDFQRLARPPPADAGGKEEKGEQKEDLKEERKEESKEEETEAETESEKEEQNEKRKAEQKEPEG